MTEIERLTISLERIQALATILQERLQDFPTEYILVELILEIAAAS